MSNQPPFGYDPQNPYGSEPSQGANPQGSAPGEYPASGAPAGGSMPGGYPPNYEPGNPGGSAPSYPQPPEYAQPGYPPPTYPPSGYPQPGQPGYEQPGYAPPGYEPPPSAPYPPYTQGYAQPGYPPGYPPGSYAAPYGAPYGGAIPQRDTRAGFAIAALVLGIISLIFSCANICDMPFIVLGLIFGVLGLQSTTRRSLAVWGLVTAGIALVIAVAFIAYSVTTHHFQFSPNPYTP